MASEHWSSRRTIGDFFAFNSFRPPTSTNYHSIRQRRLSKELEETASNIHNYNKSMTVEDDDVFLKPLTNKPQVGDPHPEFSHYSLDPKLLDALRKCGFKRPTNIQALAIPKLLEGESTIVAAETGNGKTLAFLLPLLQKTYSLKKALHADGIKDTRPKNAPLAVVVTPGRELAAQIHNVCSLLMSSAKVSDGRSGKDGCPDGLGLRIKLEMGGAIQDKIERPKEYVDVLVGTLGALYKMFKLRYYAYGSVHTLVLDEADTLLDDTFQSRSQQLIANSTLHNSYHGSAANIGNVQLVCVGATLPTNAKEALRDLVNTDELQVVKTGQLHRVLPHVHQKFIRTTNDRTGYLLDVIAKDVKKGNPVMIFSNRGATSNFVAHFLNEHGIACARFNSTVYYRHRCKELENFMEGRVNVLSCTDLASRGIDTPQVQHIVNYDFPANVTDYLHRVGRVGRVGSRVSNNGKVTNLVCGQISIAVVQELEKAVRNNTEIAHIDSNVIGIIQKRNEARELAEEEEFDNNFAKKAASELEMEVDTVLNS